MLGKNLRKIDPFYPILALVLIVLTALVIFSLRSVFNGTNTASEFDPTIATAKTKIDAEKLDKAYRATFEKEIQKLELVQ